MAQKIASKRAGRWLVFTKIIISLLVLAKISADEENRGRIFALHFCLEMNAALPTWTASVLVGIHF